MFYILVFGSGIYGMSQELISVLDPHFAYTVNLGSKIKNSYLMHLNKKYIRQDELDLKELFILECLDEAIKPNFEVIANTLSLVKSNLTLDKI